MGGREEVTPQVTPQVEERIEKVIDFCKTPRTRQEIQEFVNIKDREYFSVQILNPLIEKNIIFLN